MSCIVPKMTFFLTTSIANASLGEQFIKNKKKTIIKPLTLKLRASLETEADNEEDISEENISDWSLLDPYNVTDDCFQVVKMGNRSVLNR